MQVFPIKVVLTRRRGDHLEYKVVAIPSSIAVVGYVLEKDTSTGVDSGWVVNELLEKGGKINGNWRKFR